MDDSIWFVVLSRHGREEASLYHGFLPGWLTGKHAKKEGVVFIRKLDTLEHSEFWISQRCAVLYDHYKNGSLGNPAVVVAA